MSNMTTASTASTRSRLDRLPDHTSKLVHLVGGNTVEAAFLMGCHPSTVARALHDQITTASQERKAEAAISVLLEKRSKEAAEAKGKAEDAAAADREDANKTDTIFLVDVPSEKISSFHKIAALMGISAVPL